ncbi:uncharacterized protein BDZ99DRAFT_344301, partial [Mytilinidion resinicola]
RNIKAGFAAAGLYPLNPERVLRDMPKPPELTMPKADEVIVRPCPQDEELKTPVALVSAEALMSLQDLIIKQDAHTLDETSKRNLKRHLQIYDNTVKAGLAEGILQKKHIKFLLTINNEAKERRSAKSLILGKAKVMSYKDLKETLQKREALEQAKQAKAKRKGKGGRKGKAPLEADVSEGDTPEDEAPESAEAKPGRKTTRKRKSPPESDALEPTAKVARTIEAPEPARVPVEQEEIAPELWRAPVARMW